ncbi:MAG: hypothetical protein Q8R07_06160, partial [Candidatus Uhrbacteria bacterium]|nr:hypothetical protein [Candidatus Uhrbacteria bacterium]
MSREVPSNQGEQSPSLLSLELPPLPPLSPNDLRAGTAGFLADFSLIVEDALRYGHFQEEDRKKIERAEFLVGQTLEALIDLSSNQDAPKALATISLEDFPENMYRALFFLCKRVPEFRAQILEDPHHRLSGDHPTDFNLLYVAFRRALNTKPKTGTDSRILTLRKERLTALIKLEEKESKIELDRHIPYPVDLERVGREDVRRGAVELHARIAEEEPRLPIELKEDAHRVLSFLEAVFDPEAIEQRSHDDHKLRELLTVARVVQDPEKISLDIFPSKLFDSLLRLKMADVNLNLAFMGHDPHTVKSQVIARREDRNILDQPLPFNLFNLATLNVKQRKSDGEASLEDLYRYDEFTKLQAQHRSSIEIMSADAGARIIEAVAGNGKPWLSRAFAFSQKVLTTPISQLSEVFSDKRKQIRRELEEKLIVE